MFILLCVFCTMYVDAHFHLIDYVDCCHKNGRQPFQFIQPALVCCSAHTIRDFFRQQVFLQKSPVFSEQLQSIKKQNIRYSFGIHPQKLLPDTLPFLYKLLRAKKIHAIGECGFDLFDNYNKACLPGQYTVWNEQIAAAIHYGMPLVIHCRKALPLLFKAIPQLRRIPSVIFHGWSGNTHEAAAFLKKGVNAYFSIGKALLRGQRSVCNTAAHIDINRLLTETDAPYMNLKNELFTHPTDVCMVSRYIAELRGITVVDPIFLQTSQMYYEFMHSIAQNFYRAFPLSSCTTELN